MAHTISPRGAAELTEMLRQLSGASRTVTAVHRQIAAQLGLATKSRGLLEAARHQIARELVALAEAGQLLSHIHSPSPQPPASTPEQQAPQLSPHPNPAAVQAQLIGAVVVVPPEQFGMVGGPPFHGVVTLPHKRKGATAWRGMGGCVHRRHAHLLAPSSGDPVLASGSPGDLPCGPTAVTPPAAA